MKYFGHSLVHDILAFRLKYVSKLDRLIRQLGTETQYIPTNIPTIRLFTLQGVNESTPGHPLMVRMQTIFIFLPIYCEWLRSTLAN